MSHGCHLFSVHLFSVPAPNAARRSRKNPPTKAPGLREQVRGFFHLPLARSTLEVMLVELRGLRGGPFLRHGLEDAVVVLAVVLPIGRTGLIAANELVLAVDSHLISCAWWLRTRCRWASVRWRELWHARLGYVRPEADGDLQTGFLLRRKTQPLDDADLVDLAPLAQLGEALSLGK